MSWSIQEIVISGPLFLPKNERGCSYCDFRSLCDTTLKPATVKAKVDDSTDEAAEDVRKVLGYD